VGSQVQDHRGQAAKDETGGLQLPDGPAEAAEARVAGIAEEASGELCGRDLGGERLVHDDDVDPALGGERLGADVAGGLDHEADVLVAANTAHRPQGVRFFPSHGVTISTIDMQ
jgi:hypothetical protein